ncbi:MAG: RNA polymerase sigma factor [Acidobacteriota bacterium]
MNSIDLRVELERHHSDSFGWALACCSRNPADAENVLQSAYVKVLEGKARFDNRSSFKTWLFAIIRKTAIDYHRRETLKRLLLVRHRQNLVESTYGHFDEEVFHTEIQGIFKQSLLTLPKRQQEILQLVFYHELSLAEAAAVMQITLGAARKHYDRGKAQLRRKLIELGVSDESGFSRAENQATLS